MKGLLAILLLILVSGCVLTFAATQWSGHKSSIPENSASALLTCKDCVDAGMPAYIYKTKYLDGGVCREKWGAVALVVEKEVVNSETVVKIKTGRCSGWMKQSLLRMRR